jgi:hypothetical protein
MRVLRCRAVHWFVAEQKGPVTNKRKKSRLGKPHGFEINEAAGTISAKGLKNSSFSSSFLAPVGNELNAGETFFYLCEQRSRADIESINQFFRPLMT